MQSLQNTPSWYPLRLISLYRLFVSLVLLTFGYTDIGRSVLGNLYPQLFQTAAASYVFVAIFWLILTRAIRDSFALQTALQFATDLVFLTIMTHASGGLHGGIGALLFISVAGSCLLLRGLFAYFVAAVASIVLILDAAYFSFVMNRALNDLVDSAMLGITFFGIAFLSNLFNKRLRASEDLASSQQTAIEDLRGLNERIIEGFANGLIVISQKGDIKFANENALSLLEIDAPMFELPANLLTAFRHWQEAPSLNNHKLRFPGRAFDVNLDFAELTTGHKDILITLTDTAAATKELQTQKLTSLGHLTASIAHEVRNPLSAINHAAQLLEESTTVSSDDVRLTQIISQQSDRLNQMIENIMQLSRKSEPSPEQIELDSWLGTFRIDFCSELHISGQQFYLNIARPHQRTKFDPSQLHQIVWNLCVNSTKYGENTNGVVIIHIDCDIDNKNGRLYLDIYDEGKGIDDEQAHHIFEPFFTTSNTSSGLGLYICHELCAFNHADLQYFRREDDQKVFRIWLP